MEHAQKFTSTRKGSLLLGVLAAVIAGALIVVYVNRYRNSVRAQGAPVTVLVASSAIAKGTSGQAVASKSAVHGHDRPSEPACERRDQ